MRHHAYTFFVRWTVRSAILASTLAISSISPRLAWGQSISSELAEQLIEQQVVTVDRLNGGYVPGRGGFGAYLNNQTISPSWNGFSYAFLNRDFSQRNVDFPARKMNHLIGQSRAIYINAETSRLQGKQAQRFLEFTQRSSDFLIETAWDQIHGGWYWGIEPSGINPPQDNSDVYGPTAQTKDAYGQVHASLSLAKAYAVTRDSQHLKMALTGWQQFKTKHSELAEGYVGGYRPSFTRDYTAQVSERDLDYMLHAFEAAMALYDVTEGQEQASLFQDARDLGQHIVEQMIQMDETSFNGKRYTRAYVPWYFTPEWEPMTTQPDSTEPNFVSPGHQFEYALFLSRAVERGIGDENWLEKAEMLIEHGLHYTFDESRGVVTHEEFRISDDPYGAGESISWWPQAEAARALAHFAIVRNREDWWEEFESTFNMIQMDLTDPVYGGWFSALSPTTLEPIKPNQSLKFQPWKVYYHATMLQAELVRLSALSSTNNISKF